MVATGYNSNKDEVLNHFKMKTKTAMKTFAVYPNQMCVSVFFKRKEIETHKFTTHQQRDEIVLQLKTRKIREKNYFAY